MLPRVCLLLFFTGVQAQRKFLDADEYCAGREPDEFFREKIYDDISQDEIFSRCKVYYRCIPAGRNRFILSESVCGEAMYFDVEEQICQLKKLVENCDLWQKPQLSKPKWPLGVNDINNCPENQIECGSGECLDREKFCDYTPDCEDGSDENICSNADSDPNAAKRCDPKTCIFDEGCFCSVDGTQIPGNLPRDQVPQMITITFTGALTGEAFAIYNQIFRRNFKNKGNDCTIKGTFFVSHSFTNYSAVEELHRLGHEIGISSVTNNPQKEYWSTLDQTTYAEEFDGARLITEALANITQGEILGMRVPAGRVGGNRQFDMMMDYGFLYDSSISAPRASVPLWPYTLEHRMPHKCIGTEQNCPTRNFTIWEMVMNSMDRRENELYSEALTGCYLVDQCNFREKEQFRALLDINLKQHYTTNRAPLGLHFTSSYFLTRKTFLKEFIKWIDEVSKRPDVYFVTNMQLINWMESPVRTDSLGTYPEWQYKCQPEGLPHCSLPNPCESRPPRELADREDRMYLHTCMECPYTYPWLFNNPYGEASFGRAILKK